MSQPAPVYLVDASSYIFRAYHALPPLKNSKGIPTHAVLGFTQMLLRLIKDEAPAALALVFDSAAPTFRKILYPLYKAHRGSPPEDLLPQFDYIKKISNALGVPSFEKAGYEADDVIATLVRRSAPRLPIVIVSSDKDLMQLVDDRVVLFDTMKNKKIDSAAVQERFGVAPARLQEVLALAGDSSDHVPGVPGIGPKTAAQLIERFGSLEELYRHLDQVKGSKAEALAKFREQAFLSKQLVTLHDDVPLDASPEDLRLREPDEAECQRLFAELEFQRLLKPLTSAARTPHSPLVGAQTAAKPEPHEATSVETWDELQRRLESSDVFACLVEAEAQPLPLKPSHVAFCFGDLAVYDLPFDFLLQNSRAFEVVKTCLAQPHRTLSMHDYKERAAWLARAGLEIRAHVCDTLLAAYLLDPAGTARVDALFERYLVSSASADEDRSSAPAPQGPLSRCQSVAAIYRLGEFFKEKLKDEALWELFEQIEMPLSRVLMRMEQKGIKIDRHFLRSLQQEFGAKIEDTRKKIYALAGETFNIQSPKQLGYILFEKLQLPALKKNKTGYSTDVEVLQGLARLHDLPGQILDFRSLSKLKSTYVDALLTLADADSDRVHTHFNQAVAETGRLSSSDPNLQNIPIRSAEGAKIRRAFVAEPGFSLLSADYSQIELRVLAHLAADPVLIEAFRNEEDVHRLTAANVFGVGVQEVTPAMRNVGKTVNFSVIYGQSPFGLSQQLGIAPMQAKAYIDRYFEKYRCVQRYRESVLEAARRTGEVRTLWGRRRFVEEIRSKNKGLQSWGERMAFNTVIQGTAADLIKKAMVQISRQIEQAALRSALLLQVHDELVFEMHESEGRLLQTLVRREMEQVASFCVPLKVHLHAGANWGEAHA